MDSVLSSSFQLFWNKFADQTGTTYVRMDFIYALYKYIYIYIVWLREEVDCVDLLAEKDWV